MRDLVKTAQVLARFGPQLPVLAEQALIRLHNPPTEPNPQPNVARLSWMVLGGAVVGGLIWLGSLL